MTHHLAALALIALTMTAVAGAVALPVYAAQFLLRRCWR